MDSVSNRPFPSFKKSHFQNEAKCETFVVKMSFICIIIKNHFHINGFALSLALKVRFFGTRKWPIKWSQWVHHFLTNGLSGIDFMTYDPIRKPLINATLVYRLKQK